jgi:hypothetical protein
MIFSKNKIIFSIFNPLFILFMIFEFHLMGGYVSLVVMLLVGREGANLQARLQSRHQAHSLGQTFTGEVDQLGLIRGRRPSEGSKADRPTRQKKRIGAGRKAGEGQKS